MHSGHAARRQNIFRLLQDTWVTRNIAVTQSVYRKSYWEASARGHLNCHGGIDLDGSHSASTMKVDQTVVQSSCLVFAIAWSARNATLDTCQVPPRIATGRT